MRRHVLIVLLCLALAPAAPAGIETNHFALTSGRKTYLAVEKGQLVVGTRSRSDETKASPERWLFEDGKVRNSTSRLYLTYDPEDKEGKVFLASAPVKGARWVVVKGKGEHHIESIDAERGVIEAGSGVLKGHRLDADVVVDKGCLRLRKEPKREVVLTRLYTHK